MKYIPSFHSTRIVATRVARAKAMGLLLVSGLMLSPSAWATQVEWTGSTNSTWATGTNWTGGTAPGAANDALFNQSTYTVAPTLAAGNSALGLVFGSSNTNGITFGSGTSTLTLGSDGISMASGSGAVSTGGAAIAIASSQNWANNSGNLLTIGGKITNGATTTPLTITLNGSGAGGTTLSGIISDGASTSTTALNINTSGGTTTLSAANTFTGGLTLTAGTLIANGNAQDLGKGALSLGGGVLDLADSAARTYTVTSTTVTGNTTITSDKNASGAGLTYTFGTLSIGANTLNVSGGTNVASGTGGVTFGATTLTGNATFNITNASSGATTLLTIGAGTLGGNTLTLTGSGSFAQTGAFAADAGSVVLGVNGGTAFAGTATLSAANLNTGGVTLNSGRLNITNAGVAGTSGPLGNGGTLTINGGTLDGTVTVANVNPIVINSDFAFSTSAGTTANKLTLPGAVSLAADHTITLNGLGSLTLSGVLTNTGDSARTLTVNNGAGTGTASLLALGGYNLTGAGSTAARTDVITGSGDVTINGVIADGLSMGSGLTYNGTGTLALTGANSAGTKGSVSSTYSGNTTINSGSLLVYGGAVGNPGNGVLGTGTTVFLNGGDLSSNTLGGSGAVLSQVLSVANNATVTLGKSGTSRITFGGGVTSTGTNTIGAGASLTLYGSTIFDNALLTIGSGATVAFGATGVGTNTDSSTQTTLGGNVTFGNGTSASGSNLVFNSPIDSTGSSNAITITGAGNSFVELESGSSEYGGGVTVNNGGWLAVNGTTTVAGGAVTKGPLGTGTLTLNTSKVSGDSTDGGHAFTVANAVNIVAGSTVTLGDIADNGAGTYKGTVTIGKNSILDSPIVSYAANVTASGTNTITVASTTNLAVGQYAVGTGIAPGTTITAINTSTKVVTLSANTTGTVSGTVNFDTTNSTTFAIATATTGANGGGVVLGGTGSVVTVAPSGFSIGTSTVGSTIAFSSVISDGGAGNGINVGDGTSTGTVVFSGANTYTGATTINSGVAQYNNNTAFGANSAITVNSGATAQVIGGTLGGGTTLTINGTGALGTTGALDFNFGINNYSSLVVLGSDSTISVDAFGSNSSLNGGIDTAGHTVTLAAIGAGTDFGISGTGISNSTGTGNVIVTGGGDVTLAAASTYGGTTTIQGDSTLTSGVTNALPVGTVLTQGNSSDAAGTNTFDLGGFNQTVGGLAVGSGTLASSQVITNSGASGTNTLTVNNASTNYAYSGVIQDGSAQTALTKSGAASLTLSGVNTYTGPTTVSGGTLILASTGSTSAGSTVTVSGTLAGTGTVNGQLNTLSGSHLSPGLTAGTAGTFHLGSVGLSLGTGSNLDYDLATTPTGTNDLISMTGGSLSLGTALTFNINELGGSLATGTNYDLISGFSNGGLSLAGITFTTTGDPGLTATYSVVNVGGTNELVASFANGSTGSTSYFYTGGTSSDFTDFHNYNTTASGGTQQTTALSSTSDVSLSASPAPTTNVNPTLGTNNLAINSLTFTNTGANVTLNGTGTLTLAAASSVGITDNSATTNSVETVAPTVALGASQTWTVANSTSTLAITGGISGTSGQTLTLAGPGTYNFSSGTTGAKFAGNTTVNGSAKLLLTNTSGSALGTGALNVAGGSTIGGAGSATGMSSFTIGNGSQSLATVQVGAGGTNTTSSLTLQATGASSITNANLTFNLNSSVAGQANQLNIGATGLTFGTGVSLTLNLVNNTLIASNTPYILVAGTASGSGTGQYSGITVDANNKIISGLTFSFVGSQPPAYYANSYLFLVDNGGVDDIEVEVVPEPSTWAMIFGGLGMLLFWQRRKTRRD
jgi:fibronectin-binding autotransporter adhesin